jgi:hypothetical protein
MKIYSGIHHREWVNNGPATGFNSTPCKVRMIAVVTASSAEAAKVTPTQVSIWEDPYTR